MTDFRDVLERELERLTPPRIPQEGLQRRRDRKIRSQRVTAAIVAIAVSLLAAAGLIRAFSVDPDTGDRTIQPVGADVSFVDVRTGTAHPLPTSITAVPMIDYIQVSPDGSKLAFQGAESARVGTKRQIYVAEIDGTGLRRLTSDEDIEALHPRWSPDGSRIVFEGSDWKNVDLFEVETRTGAVRRITQRLATAFPRVDPHPTYTPDGDSIVYTIGGGSPPRFSLRMIPIRGGQSSLLMSNAALGAYSPDGRSLSFRPISVGLFDSFAFVGVSFADADGSDRRRGTFGTGNATSPVSGSSWVAEWSPDGTRVAFTDPTQGDRRLFVFDPSSERRTWLGLAVGGVTWLDDDTLIVRGYEARSDRATPTPSPNQDSGEEGSRRADLSFVDLSTGHGNSLPLSIRSMQGIQSVQVSPDGSMFVFEAESGSDGRHQVFVSDVDGSSIRRISHGIWQAVHPSWSPDGTRLVYEGHARLWNVRIYIADVVGGGRSRLVTLPGVQTYAAMPRFSSNGAEILYTREGSNRIGLWSKPIDGGRERLVLGGAAFGSYSPDGRTILYRHAGLMPGLQTGISFFGDLVPADGTQSGTFPMGMFFGIDLFDSPGAMPLWSPDGQKVLYRDPFTDPDMSDDEVDLPLSEGYLYVFDIESGERTRVGLATEASWFDDHTLIALDFRPR